MKKILLLFMVLISSVGHASYISTMLPAERENLFISVVEVADAYQEIGKVSKANSFYRSAVDIYPVGDLAHRVASKQGITLDDEVTYTNFVLDGTTAFNAGNYDVAVASYLMANELDNSPELYQKIAEAYAMLGDRVKADHYNDLVVQSSYETVVSSSEEDAVEEDVVEEDVVEEDVVEEIIIAEDYIIEDENGEVVEEIIIIDDMIVEDGEVVEETIIIEDIIYDNTVEESTDDEESEESVNDEGSNEESDEDFERVAEEINLIAEEDYQNILN